MECKCIIYVFIETIVWKKLFVGINFIAPNYHHFSQAQTIKMLEKKSTPHTTVPKLNDGGKFKRSSSICGYILQSKKVH